MSTFFTQRVVRHWNLLSREVVVDPSVEAFENTLDEDLGRLIWWLATLPMPRGLFYPKPLTILGHLKV